MDPCRVDHANLSVCFLSESGAFIRRATFDKDAHYGRYRRLYRYLKDRVKRSDYGAVQLTQPLIGSAVINRCLHTGSFKCAHQSLMGCLDLLDSRSCRQIEAQPQIDNGSDDRGLPGCLVSLLLLTRELKRPAGIRLPKIYPRTQPIVFILTLAERMSGQHGPRCFVAAAVVSEHERCREPVHRLLIILRQFTVGSQDAELLELPCRHLFRHSISSSVGLCRFKESASLVVAADH